MQCLADPRSYTLQVIFDYQDAELRTHTATELLSIPVAQTTRLEAIWMRDIPSFVNAGDMIFFELRATNTGRVDLINVRVRTEGPWDMSEAGMFIGPLRAQSAMTFNGRFIPFEPGDFEGAVIIYGEDATGAIVEYVHNFTLSVSEGFGGDFMGDDFMGGDWDDAWRDPWDEDMWNDGYDEGGEGFFAGLWENLQRPIVFGPIAALVGIAVITAVVLVRRKRMRLDFDEDEGSDK